MSAVQSIWSTRFGAWKSARDIELTYDRTVLAKADATGVLTPAMEAEADAFQKVRCDLETSVLACPAVNAEQLAVKVLIAFDGGREADAYLPAILQDARRLSPPLPAYGDEKAVRGSDRIADAGHRGLLNERNAAFEVANDMFVSGFDADFACSRMNIIENMLFDTAARTDDDVIAKLIAFAQVVAEGNEPSEEMAAALVAEGISHFGMGSLRQDQEPLLTEAAA